MGDADSTDILLIGDPTEEVRSVFASTGSEFLVSTCSDINQAVGIMVSRSIRIAIVLSYQMDNLGISLLRHLRNTFFQEPVQILSCIGKTMQARTIIEHGADDYLIYPCETGEFQAKVYAAVIRLRSLIRIYGEKEFFRKAAKQEEELSSRILDQHLILRDAFQSIESINQELEETNKQLEQVARFDNLSGLMNRHSLFNAMDSEIERAERTRSPLSGIMMDVDNFKEVNDRFGHLRRQSDRRNWAEAQGVVAEIRFRGQVWRGGVLCYSAQFHTSASPYYRGAVQKRNGGECHGNFR